MDLTEVVRFTKVVAEWLFWSSLFLEKEKMEDLLTIRNFPYISELGDPKEVYMMASL